MNIKVDNSDPVPETANSDTLDHQGSDALAQVIDGDTQSAPPEQSQPQDSTLSPSPPAGEEGLFGPGIGPLIGSVLDPDSGVFEVRGSYSTWEQFSEQAFADLDDLMNIGDEGLDDMLFGSQEREDDAPLFEGGRADLFDDQDTFGPAIPISDFPQIPILPDLSLTYPPAWDNQDSDNYYDEDRNDAVADTGNDPLFAQQWYLKNTTGGVDINVSKAWESFTGKGVKVAVCDDGVDYNHPDLQPNYLSSMDYDAESNTNDGKPRIASDNHGTAVAGFIGAAKNGYGIMGTAYEAGIASLRSGDEAETGAALEKAVDFDVCSNSWTFAPFAKTPNIDTALKNIAENGRGGLGTVTTFCASNERGEDIMSGYYSMNDSPYTLTVGAVSASGEHSDFSCAGPNLLVTAPGENVLSTDRTPSAGYDSSSYFHSGDGTSYSTPIVSGVIALMLEANSNLGYRDVHSILAYTAIKTSAMSSPDDKPWDWEINSASNWNGGGMHASHDYGFGLVDATAAVRMAESWDFGQHTYSNQATQTASVSPNQVIPDNTGSSLTTTVAIGSDILVQQALVTVTIDHFSFTNLEMTLLSPGGIESTLFYHPTFEGLAGESKQTVADYRNDMAGTFVTSSTWTFKTVMPFGEHGQGNWSLEVKDTVSGDEGTLNSWTLMLYGDNVTTNDLYMFTDEFSALADDDMNRQMITDTAGTDTINASGVTSASAIDLTPGGTSTIDGAAMTISAGTIIENVHTGDGNDSITGNTSDNCLFGWRGTDTISGLDGNDLFGGGLGADTLTGGIGNDTFYYGTANEGGDYITDFNHTDDAFSFSFSDFGQSAIGNLAADHFFTALATVDVSDACFIYESDTLWYDSDGTGANLSVEISQITGDAVQVDDIVFV